MFYLTTRSTHFIYGITNNAAQFSIVMKLAIKSKKTKIWIFIGGGGGGGGRIHITIFSHYFQ